jgi:hypothetical protein
MFYLENGNKDANFCRSGLRAILDEKLYLMTVFEA